VDGRRRSEWEWGRELKFDGSFAVIWGKLTKRSSDGFESYWKKNCAERVFRVKYNIVKLIESVTTKLV
jgi:hypothetical protein